MINYTNHHNINPALAVWLMADDYDHRAGLRNISATALLKPTRMLVLQKVLQRDDLLNIEIDISTLVKSRMGQAIHSDIEKAWYKNSKSALKSLGYSEDFTSRVVINPDVDDLDSHPEWIPVYIEQRGEIQFGDWNVTGKFDFVFDGQLQDTKSTSTFTLLSGKNDEHYTQQGSIYRLIFPKIITKNTLLINFVFTDHSSARVGQGNYPTTAAHTVEYPLLSTEETEQFITSKLADLDRYLDFTDQSELPLCSDEELWKNPPVYKYYSKPDSKRATKASSDLNEIKALYIKNGGQGRIETIKGEARRCAYCLVREVCEQYKGM